MTDVMTTGQIAAEAGVSSVTVGRWIDSGLLPGFRIPGSKFRRATRSAFDAFARAHGLPCRRRFLACLISSDRALAYQLSTYLPPDALELFPSTFAAGLGLAGKPLPYHLILDSADVYAPAVASVPRVGRLHYLARSPADIGRLHLLARSADDVDAYRAAGLAGLTYWNLSGSNCLTDLATALLKRTSNNVDHAA